ncbi:cytochrome c553 [Aeromonas sp. BIGb0405]|uniref:c-type cytochrome n=1 Tax=Aeromonas sp. BIGb0405 TaxID=2940592 RepID=UPI0021690ECE|nr:c-type cytochrome [Aeromonas sp. BIGb0405]MCS3457109.1 cytochrome c553 [Aeromonas sp. BIGb0405]
MSIKMRALLTTLLTCLVPPLAQAAQATQDVPQICGTCHGLNGVPKESNIPSLWGQSEAYLTEQLHAFRSGKRVSDFMNPIIYQLSDEQIKRAANHFASQSAAKEVALHWSGEKWPGDMDAGERLALAGKPDRNLPACVACHGPSGIGVMPLFPRLAGQDPAYLKRQLMYWKADKRPAGAMGSMSAIAKSLSESEVEAVANYFAAQGVTK